MKSLMKDAYEDLEILDKTGKKFKTAQLENSLNYINPAYPYLSTCKNPEKIGLAKKIYKLLFGHGGRPFGKISKINLFKSQRRVC